MEDICKHSQMYNKMIGGCQNRLIRVLFITDRLIIILQCLVKETDFKLIFSWFHLHLVCLLTVFFRTTIIATESQH